MNNKTKAVVRGWIALSESERREVEDEIRKYRQGTAEVQKSLRETTMDLGPVGSGCPCCGRS